VGLTADPFSYPVTKSGEVRISRGGRVVVMLPGVPTDRVAVRLDAGDEAFQQLLTRVTGNDQRGNDRRR
jgi:hypothetical protein